jgi:hypothetical protein
MAYQFEIHPSSISLYNWGATFSCLSTQQFRLIFDYLDFPIEPSDELRHLARDFSIFYYANIDRKRRELPEINLLEGVLPSDTWKDRIEILFTNTFKHLDSMNYAEKIYQWEVHTSDYYPVLYREPLNALCNFLRVWAVFEWLKQPISSEHELYSSDWNRVIAKWSPIYAQNVKEEVTPMPLSTETCTKLQTIVLQQETRHMLFGAALDQIKSSPKTEWEEFAFDKIWIGLEANFRINLQEWKMIAATLSHEEIDLLEQWPLQHKEHYHDLNFPLPLYFKNFDTNWIQKLLKHQHNGL